MQRFSFPQNAPYTQKLLKFSVFEFSFQFHREKLRKQEDRQTGQFSQFSHCRKPETKNENSRFLLQHDSGIRRSAIIRSDHRVVSCWCHHECCHVTHVTTSYTVQCTVFYQIRSMLLYQWLESKHRHLKLANNCTPSLASVTDRAISVHS